LRPYSRTEIHAFFLTSSLSERRDEIAAYSYKRAVMEVDEDVQPLNLVF